MNKIIAKAGLLMLAGAFIALGMFSCRKEIPTVARVLVVDTGGVPQPDVMVRLFPTPTIDIHGAVIIDDTLFTDNNGLVTFDFSEHFNLGQAGVFVLDIEVRDEDMFGDPRFGTGIIKVEQEETVEESVIIQ